MNIILVSAPIQNPYDSGHYIKKALNKMDHDVIHLDFRSDGHTINQDILDISKANKIDLLLVWKGSTLDPNMVAGLTYPTVMWYPDDMRTSHGQDDLSRLGDCFNLLYTPIEENIEALSEYDAKFLPPGVDTESFYNTCIPAKYKAFDFSHVGSLYPERVRILTTLKTVADRGKKPFYVGCLWGSDYINMINNSRINLNIGINFSGTQLRILEVLSTGNFLMTNETNFMKEHFEGCVALFNESNIMNTYNTYIIDNNKREDMIEESCKRVINSHKWEDRLNVIFQDLGV